MTKPNLLELAKQGNPQAIAALMNHSLKPKGIVAKVQAQGDRLQVLLEAAQTPNRQVLTNFVRNGLNHLNIDSIQFVQVSGQQTGANQPAWTQRLEVGPSSLNSSQPVPGAATSAPKSVAPPPPKRPMEMPPPPPRPPITASPTVLQPDDETPVVSGSPSSNEVASVSSQPNVISDNESDEFDLDYLDDDDEPDETLLSQPPTARHHEELDDLLSDDQFIDNLLTDEARATGYSQSALSITDAAEPDIDAPELPENIKELDDVVIGDAQTEYGIADGDDNDQPKTISPDEPEGEAIETTGDDGDALPASQSGRDSTTPNRILFILILFIVAGWLFGMIGYSLWAHLSNPSEQLDLSPSSRSALPTGTEPIPFDGSPPI
ncbi:MAG: hypothetical protein ACFE0J_13345 [Elainellaceae cyanobacterium]